MGRCAELFALSMAAVILLHSVMFIAHPGTSALPMALTFAAAAVPFVFGGIFVCLALTRFPRRVGQLYAFDLAGAAIGCLLVIVALNWLDGVGAVIACATLTTLAAALLLRGAEQALAVLLDRGARRHHGVGGRPSRALRPRRVSRCATSRASTATRSTTSAGTRSRASP